MQHARENYIGLQTIVIKEVIRFSRVWTQSLLPSVITTLLYFVIFGHVVGQRIGMMGDVSYINYIAPGLIMMAVITNAYSNVSTAFYLAKFQRNVDEMLISPMPNWVILVGFVVSGVLRGILVALLVTIVTLFFTHLQVRHVWIVITSVLLSAILFSLAGFINAVYAKKFDDIAFIPTFVLTPLTYFGGVFYSIDLLPGVWQKISHLNPILYLVNAFRYGMLGVSDVRIGVALGLIIVAVFGLYFFALHLLRKGTGLRN